MKSCDAYAVLQVVWCCCTLQTWQISYMYFFITQCHTPLGSILVTVCLVHMEIDGICGQRQFQWFNRRVFRMDNIHLLWIPLCWLHHPNRRLIRKKVSR